MITLLKKLEGSSDIASIRFLENMANVIEYMKLMTQERGKRAVERHWMLRSAGNRMQRQNPKGSRRYSYLGLRYTQVKKQLYFRWVRYRFMTEKAGSKKVAYGRTISPDEGQGYDLRKLKRGTAAWERNGITHTEKYLKEIRGVQLILKEMRSNTLRLANALAKLDKADHEHYKKIREELFDMGYTQEECDRIEHAHLEVMERAATEGADILPLSRSRMYDPEKGIPKIEAPTVKVLAESEDTVDDVAEALEDSTAEMIPEEARLERATEDDDVGLPDPDLYRRLHERGRGD